MRYQVNSNDKPCGNEEIVLKLLQGHFSKLEAKVVFFFQISLCDN